MGLATARAFAQAGASVALADVKEEAVRKAAEQVAGELRTGDNVTIAPGNVYSRSPKLRKPMAI
jgi:NAD(P)-dependent dehydrogenase (short-subunit alcohol dehydrogenase family)